ncbi:hypothetical protein bcgnr5383_44970 [Bacillus cereus]|nr:hypothetical protein BwiPL1_35720 [Bacillus wiedmannii]
MYRLVGVKNDRNCFFFKESGFKRVVNKKGIYTFSLHIFEKVYNMMKKEACTYETIRYFYLSRTFNSRER